MVEITTYYCEDGMDKKNFDIVLSYASEDKAIVSEFKNKLETGTKLKVYDYEDNKHLTIFKNVPEVLKEIYRNENSIMIIFLSSHYLEKKFTLYESQYACERMLNNQKLIIIKLEDVETLWLPSTRDYLTILNGTSDEIDYVVSVIKKALNYKEENSLTKLYKEIKITFSPFMTNKSVDRKKINSNNFLINKTEYLIDKKTNEILIWRVESNNSIHPMPILHIKEDINGYKLNSLYPIDIDNKFYISGNAQTIISIINKILTTGIDDEPI